jgi:hypothetical protein
MIQPRITDLHNPSYGYKESKPKKKRSKHRSRSNPGPFALTLGLIGANPKKGERTMAKKRKKNKKKATRAPAKANRSRKNRKGKRKNPGVSMATIKRIMGKKKGKGRRGKRNPAWLGMSSSDAIGNSVAILGAVTGAKLIPPMLPANWSNTDLGRFLTTLGVAVGEVTLAHFMFPKYRTMVLAGAGAQTISTALNPLLRKISSTITLGRIQQARAMGQLRDFVPANFPEPHNPIYQQMMLAAAMNPGATAGGGSVGRYRGRFR